MMESMQDLLDVTVKVPGDRIADFYAMYGRWLGGEQLVEVVDTDSVDNQRLPWDTKEDLALAKEAWALFPKRAQLVFSTLIDNPGKQFSGDELANMHDIPNGKWGVAGVLAWPGRYLWKLGRVLHFKADPNPEGGSLYSMEPDLADLFRRARDTS